MNEIDSLQPKPFRDVGPQLFAPRDDEDVVPNPFAIPPEWLAVWQEEADDQAAMEAAAGAARDAEDLKAESAKADAAAAKDGKKADGIIASLSAAIPKFFQSEEKKIDKAVAPEKKASGIFEDLQGAVQGALGGAGQQAGAGAAKGVLEQVQGALSGIGGQVGAIGQQAGQQAGAGAGQGLLESIKAGIPGLISTAQQAAQPAVQQVVTGAVDAARPGVAELAHTAGQHATAGAQEQLKKEGTGLGVDTTTLVVGGVAVLGALGLGAWLLSGDKKFGATSTEELQKLLDKASWTRPAGAPAVRWLEAPESTRARSALQPTSTGDSGLGAGIAIVGGASALAVLIGYWLKGGFHANKTASGAYGTGLTGSSPSGHIGHRGSWWKDRQSGATGSPLVMRSSPLHPFTLADSLGLAKELLHLDQTAILGPSPSQKDHDDFFAGYPIGHKAGADNCDAARLNKGGTVYLKDATKSQAWDNGWLKGYYDGWIAEGCKATLPHTTTAKTASGPEEEWEAGERPHGNEYWWATESTASGPESTWNYVFTYFDGTTMVDQTPTPNSQVSVMDNLAPDTARAAKAVKVDRVRFPDNFKVTVWTADKGASGPPPAIGILPGLYSVLLPWQREAAVKYKLSHPNFGSDYQEMIRVLAISPAQIAKANAAYRPFAGADAAAAVQAGAASDPGSQWTQGAPSGPPQTQTAQAPSGDDGETT